ncbi:DUF1697 domain-containing protein [Paenibacillus sp.]|uniref:DUF1697 domain-containing protein n=1 Tax=Paenibacillus sp. TaxID=58172 RepID=UPI002D5DA6A0|nr:DUF1697 domain-containing protein [Paenibacillus sp.]HZG56256.1 DUF1697 domain-containing protein [Paenibacillus sp.]
MTGYIALLRGINVGGNNVVKMAELRDALAQDGFARVRTYIQSGNVLLEADEDEARVRERVEAVVSRMLGGKPMDAVVRSFAELERLMAECPYPVDAPEEGKRVMFALLQEPLAADALAAALGGVETDDEYEARGRDVYFRFRGNVLESPLGERMMKLGGKRTTTRNWNTMNKLLELSRE